MSSTAAPNGSFFLQEVDATDASFGNRELQAVCHTAARRQHAVTCSGLIHRRMQGVRWSKDSLPPYRVVFLATQATQMEYIKSVDQHTAGAKIG